MTKSLTSDVEAAWRSGAFGLDVDADEDAVWRAFADLGWTDGLPIVLPTTERVERMLQHLPTLTNVSTIPPSNRALTGEMIAVNSVMAGCESDVLPGVVAALQALTNPVFNLSGVQTTTSATAPVLIFGGQFPVEVGMESGNDAFGGSSRVNATLGRAVRLILRNVGGATPPRIDKATIGSPLKLTAAFAENESASPWRPFAQRREGSGVGESCVTAFACTGFVEIRDSDSTSAEGLLSITALAMRNGAWIACNNSGDGRAEALLAVTPEHAELLDRARLSPEQVAERLWQRAVIPLQDFPNEIRAEIREWRSERDLDPDPVTVTESPDDISLVVLGGSGTKSMFLPTWGAFSQSVSVRF